MKKIMLFVDEIFCSCFVDRKRELTKFVDRIEDF